MNARFIIKRLSGFCCDEDVGRGPFSWNSDQAKLDIGEVVYRRSPSQDERTKAIAFLESEENGGQK